MAKVRLILDTRKSSKNAISKLFPIALRVFHAKPRIIRLPYETSKSGWDSNSISLKRSVLVNKGLDCSKINYILYNKLHDARSLINELGDAIQYLDVDTLVEEIKKKWENQISPELKSKMSNGLMLTDWGQVIIDRKLKSNKPSSAEWYKSGIKAFIKFNNNKDLRLDQLNVTMLKDYQIHKESEGVKPNSISSVLRAIRAIYNAAINEDRIEVAKNPFHRYKIPSSNQTKKRAISKDDFLNIRKLNYEKGSALWHTKNYALIMFNCRGMNLIDLVKLKKSNVRLERIFYGRSKTGDPLSVKLTSELKEILGHYLENKKDDDFLFPSNYDGSTAKYEKYKTIRRRVNERLKIIAVDAGIEQHFTTYAIRHSWATIAKFMGISTAIISEGLGHSSLKTTEIYLKRFDNDTLDEANERIVA
ncbi:tyrosine-type recombinase/integrase [uncultured Maribacter sp.]|uniref:tyrosine-type recombinase/integrase n=1 Tax=uncultured Maribacter sp. TaxID=431308 RepID=UPI0030D7B834|tara:strand:+ start:207 stop:1463 length:1257 start_codon:yes stop_codon:yes gene_type:complete